MYIHVHCVHVHVHVNVPIHIVLIVLMLVLVYAICLVYSCCTATNAINGASIQGLTRCHDRQQWQLLHHRAETCEWTVDVGRSWNHMSSSW